ncbi:hypothetical protein [Breoghania sp.]|uniref:hypothetical protein n=1 Tax=Breoghania sp. TaxID=2065378 RepID=UPI0026291337|nr:hypothetical protein [Breoghania sp.]
MPCSTNHVASAVLMVTNHGLDDHWKAPVATPSMPKTISSASQWVAVRPDTLTISEFGERHSRCTASRKPEQRAHMWQSDELIMVRTGTSGAQLNGSRAGL